MADHSKVVDLTGDEEESRPKEKRKREDNDAASDALARKLQRQDQQQEQQDELLRGEDDAPAARQSSSSSSSAAPPLPTSARVNMIDIDMLLIKGSVTSVVEYITIKFLGGRTILEATVENIARLRVESETYIEKGHGLAKKNKEMGKDLAAILITRARWHTSRGESNVRLVSWLAHIIKDLLPKASKNSISFVLYWATWKLMIEDPATASFLFGDCWGGHWGWWIKTARERKTQKNWIGILSKMTESGLRVGAYDRWPAPGTVLFENDAMRLVAGAGETYNVLFK
mmetsp:Transcript_16983/g.37104  ORF Transcript_16983/g.37104 Transcript_16983/m.37104 type:complete len:286 (-) Transcript_16983:306-1163(-)